MKVTFPQPVLLNALNKGAMAAISDRAESDTSNMSDLVKGVRITVEVDKVIIESATDVIATRYVIDEAKNSGIDITATGAILVNGPKLYKWAKVEGKDSMLTFNLDTSKIPPQKDGEDKILSRIGTVKISSKTMDRTAQRWTLESLNPENALAADFNKKPATDFSVNVGEFKKGYSYVSSVVDDKDMMHIKDNVSVQHLDNRAYLVATDLSGGMLYEFDAKSYKFPNPKTLIMNSVTLGTILKELKEDKAVDISFDAAKIYLAQSDWDVRIATLEEKEAKDYPSFQKPLSNSSKYVSVGTMSKSALEKRLIASCLVNKGYCQYVFEKDSDMMVINTVSENGEEANSEGDAPLSTKAVKSVKFILGTPKVLAYLKSIKSSEIEILVMATDKDMPPIKFFGKDDAGLITFRTQIKNTKFA